MKTTFSYIFIAFICVSLSVFGQTKEKKDGLNGQTYKITLTQTGGDKTGWHWTTDELSFNSGMIGTKTMREHEKFDDITCDMIMESDANGKILTFKAEGKNPGGSKIKWKGKAVNGHIEGTVVWTNAQGKQSYSFTGTLAK